MTRRDFTKLSISSFLLGGGVIMSNATPRRSLLAAKRIANIRQKPSGWSNPYANSTLIAMWDGEWNVAGGVHDGTANRWVDIVGGRTLGLKGSAAFGANYMETTDVISGAIGDFDLDAAYFEMVIYVGRTADWYSIIDGLSGKWVWGEPKNYNNQNGGIGYLYWGGTADLRAEGIMQVAMSLDGSVCLVNGRSVEVDTAYSDDAIGPFAIFGNVDNIGEERCCLGKCYSARFFSAIPSASQRAASNAIDRERFGVP